jgi:hypothetical protein
MLGNPRLALPTGDAGYAASGVARARRAAHRRPPRTALLLSLGVLVSPTLLDFFSPAEIALAWLEHLAELAVLAAGLLLAYTLLDEALPRTLPMRLALVCALLLPHRERPGAAAVRLLRAWLHPPATAVAAAVRRLAHWGLPAVFLAVIADVHQRALRADSAAHAADLARVQQGQGEAEQQLALLQAQIEPHFLFNMLGNVRGCTAPARRPAPMPSTA